MASFDKNETRLALDIIYANFTILLEQSQSRIQFLKKTSLAAANQSDLDIDTLLLTFSQCNISKDDFLMNTWDKMMK